MEEGLCTVMLVSLPALLLVEWQKTMQKKKRRETAEVTESSQEWYFFLIPIRAACLNSASVINESHYSLISHNKIIKGSLHLIL